MSARQEPWPDHVRQRALALFAEEGGTVASAETGVPANTIRSWARREGERADLVVMGTGVTPSAAVGSRWAERRPAVVDDLSRAADEAMQKLREALTDGKARDAQHYAIVTGVLIDKAQLLAGGATARTESKVATIDLTKVSAYSEAIRLAEERLGITRGEQP